MEMLRSWRRMQEISWKVICSNLPEQSESFKQTQEEFKEYMKALQSDINERAKVYGFIEFFDAEPSR